MSKQLKNTFAILFLILCFQTDAFAMKSGEISGILILDDSWERQIYVSLMKTLDNEYVVSNDLIITSADVDSLGNFKIALDEIPVEWSLLRLHVVKKGVSPNSLAIGSLDENFMFLIAKKDSEIKLYNTDGKPIFENTRVEGAEYMNTFDYIKKLTRYPNAVDYDNTLIEKEFIKEVVSEKLKMVADTCTNPLVSLYAIYQTDFQTNYYKDATFYKNYLSKWKSENNTYFKSFRLKFPKNEITSAHQNQSTYVYVFITLVILVFIGVFLYRKRGHDLKNLSVQERKVFSLLRTGMSNKEIAAECNIELTTVKSHVGNIYAKLKIKSRKEAINLKTNS